MASIIGLQAIALTDHNSCRNCPALADAAKAYGISVIPGMEFCTEEEVHVLCFFPSLNQAMEFDGFVYEKLPDIPNNPMLFGNQQIYNKEDQLTGTLDKLLISAVPVSFSDLPGILNEFGGIMIPAHIDKPSNSLISNLGFVPADSTFKTAEFHDLKMEIFFKNPIRIWKAAVFCVLLMPIISMTSMNRFTGLTFLKIIQRKFSGSCPEHNFSNKKNISAKN